MKTMNILWAIYGFFVTTIATIVGTMSIILSTTKIGVISGIVLLCGGILLIGCLCIFFGEYMEEDEDGTTKKRH